VTDGQDSGSEGDLADSTPPAPGPFPGHAPPPPPPSWPAPSPPGPPQADLVSPPWTAQAPSGAPQFPSAPPQGVGSYPPPPPPLPPESGQNASIFAGWGIRVGGYLIDFVIFAAVTLVLVLLMRHNHTLEVHYMMKRGTDRRRSFSALPFIISGLLYVVYGTVLCGSRRGQTVGMMAVGIRAVRDGTHERLGYARAAIRAVAEGVLRLFELLNPILVLIWLLDVLFPIWDKKRQTLHDKVGRSVVLRGQPPADRLQGPGGTTPV
jgi:uncharacterized RDD family membrane protein YckC